MLDLNEGIDEYEVKIILKIEKRVVHNIRFPCWINNIINHNDNHQNNEDNNINKNADKNNRDDSDTETYDNNNGNVSSNNTSLERIVTRLTKTIIYSKKREKQYKRWIQSLQRHWWKEERFKV